MPAMHTVPLYLASTSPYRKALLAKLNYPFTCANPNVDEQAIPGETAPELVQRLALAKAQAVATTLDDALVIGSDQVALFNGDIIGKPHSAENAFAQLSRFSGQKVCFLTGLALVNAKTQQYQLAVEPFYVHFRALTAPEIQRYIELELPLNCAGSFKSEGLGISLFSKLEGDDPNSLIGLPLIRLNQLLLNEGLNVLLV